jgi:Tol biopolymer transport system component
VVAYCLSAEETWTYRGRPARPGFPVAGPTAEGETRLVSLDIATEAASALPAGPGVKVFPSILPSGELAYVRKGVRIQGLFYGAGKPGPGGAVGSPSWSPDGDRLVYHKVLSSETPDWRRTFSRDSRYELVLTRWLPSFDPTGDRIVATRAGTGGLVLVETGADRSSTLFEQEGKGAMAAQWSAKGDAIIFGLGAFFEGRSQGAQVAVIKPDGSGFRQVTSGANNNGFPSLSPDGTRFVYRTSGPEGQGLRIKSFEDSSVATLTTGYDNFPVWSPRGDLIVFVRKYEGDYEIFSIRPDGKDLRRLTRSPGNEGHLAWSPDGEWILFSSSRMGFKDEALYTDSPQPYGEIFVMRYDGTQVQQLTDNQWEEATPAWRPAGARTNH